jgi:osmotically inducible protein OsmC
MAGRAPSGRAGILNQALDLEELSMARTAKATWNGGLKDGDGAMALGSGAFEGPFSYKSRFEDGEGTNPEELIGAALAGCFSMALAAGLEADGKKPFAIESEARVHMRNVDGTPTITRIDVATRGRVEGIDQEAFERAAERSKKDCIISRALGGVEEMNVEATLEG